MNKPTPSPPPRKVIPIKRRWWNAVGLPPELYDKFYDEDDNWGLDESYKDQVAWKKLDTYFSNMNAHTAKGLYLWGKPGLAKTHLAVMLLGSIMQNFVYDKPDFRFMKCADMMDLIKEKMDAKKGEELHEIRERLASCREARWLVLDDVGQENRSEWNSVQINNLIRHRYAAGNTTLMTSNLSPEDYEERYGVPAGSFLWEATIPIRFKGKDYRRSKAHLDAQP